MKKSQKNAPLQHEPAAVGRIGIGAPTEFGRWRDVERVFGIKRGTLYKLIKERKVRTVTLREPGKLFGCRLIYMPSVRAYLHGLLEEQSGEEQK